MLVRWTALSNPLWFMPAAQPILPGAISCTLSSHPNGGAGGPALLHVPSVLLLGLPRPRLTHDAQVIWASALIKAENFS